MRQGRRRVGAPIRVSPHDAGLTRAYLPLPVTFPEPGTFDLRWHYRGSELVTSIKVVEPSEVHLPQVGSPLPPVATPTTDDHRGVDPICTNDPPCPFHTHNLVDSLAAHRPVLLLLSTPRYCQTAICGPVLDLLIDAAPTGRDVVHVEVFPNATGTDTGPASAIVTDAFGLTFEPVLYVAGADGIVTARLDSIYDGTELAAALA